MLYAALKHGLLLRRYCYTGKANRRGSHSDPQFLAPSDMLLRSIVFWLVYLCISTISDSRLVRMGVLPDMSQFMAWQLLK